MESDAKAPGRPRLTVQSIEHSSEWVMMLRDKNPLVVRRAEARGSLDFRIPEIGPTGDWGRPTNWMGREPRLRLKQARSYVEPEGIKCCYDMIFIDGRFREVRTKWTLHVIEVGHSYHADLLTYNISLASLARRRARCKRCASRTTTRS